MIQSMFKVSFLCLIHYFILEKIINYSLELLISFSVSIIFFAKSNYNLSNQYYSCHLKYIPSTPPYIAIEKEQNKVIKMIIAFLTQK